jgi:hypothetical protein
MVTGGRDLRGGGLLHELEEVGGRPHRLRYLLCHRRFRSPSSAAAARCSHPLLSTSAARRRTIRKQPQAQPNPWAIWAKWLPKSSLSKFLTIYKVLHENNPTPLERAPPSKPPAGEAGGRRWRLPRGGRRRWGRCRSWWSHCVASPSPMAHGSGASLLSGTWPPGVAIVVPVCLLVLDWIWFDWDAGVSRRTFSLYDQINLIDSVPEDQLRFQSYAIYPCILSPHYFSLLLFNFRNFKGLGCSLYLLILRYDVYANARV